jgi:hypothetical protein
LSDPVRLAALHATGLLDAPPQPELDELSRMVSWLLDAPAPRSRSSTPPTTCSPSSAPSTTSPREWSDDDIAALRRLAHHAIAELTRLAQRAEV